MRTLLLVKSHVGQGLFFVGLCFFLVAGFTYLEPTAVASAQGETPGSQVQPDSLPDLIDSLQPRIVKVFGAGVGNVEAYSTGVLVSSDGLIVTSQGVYLDGARTLVVLWDGRVFEATVLRRDRRRQLGLLKIDASGLDCFTLGNGEESAIANPDPNPEEGSELPQDRLPPDRPSDQSPAATVTPPLQGQWVVTLSNAFRVADKQEPVSAWLGIVALPTSIDAWLNQRDIAYSGRLILIDSITSNPGAAGGAVVGLDRNLIGVIGKIIESSETNTRLNYAIPVDLVRDFVNGRLAEMPESVEAKADFVAGETGIFLFQLGGKSGPAFVERVKTDSVAAKAGIEPDDLIISVAGEKTATTRNCETAFGKLAAGTEVVIVVKRGDRLLRVDLTPAQSADRGDK